MAAIRFSTSTFFGAIARAFCSVTCASASWLSACCTPARSRYAFTSFGLLSTTFCLELICELSELPLDLPRKTKPAANTTARKTYATFACVRRREKKSCSSHAGVAFFFFRFGGSGWRLRCACVAPRAIAGLGYLPIVRIGDSPKAPFRLLVAERTLQSSLIGVARVEAQPLGRVVVLTQVGAEHGGVVRRDRAVDTGGDERRQRVLVERGDDPRAQVRDRADVEHHLPVGDLPHEAWILDRADPVPETIGAELLERAAHRRRPRDLAGVRDGGEPQLARKVERRRVRLRREVRLEPAQPDADDTAVAVASGPADELLRLGEREPAHDVGR